VVGAEQFLLEHAAPPAEVERCVLAQREGFRQSALGRAGRKQTMAFVIVAAPALREPFGMVAALALAPVLLVEVAKAVRPG
jgi:hypothetical protein